MRDFAVRLRHRPWWQRLVIAGLSSRYPSHAIIGMRMHAALVF